MVKEVRNKIILLTALVMIVGFLFYATAGFFMQDRWLAARVRAELQSDFIGVNIIIKNVQWDGINGISATSVIFQDIHDRSIPFQCKKLTFRFDLPSLLINTKHPRRALRGINLIEPRFGVKRFSNGTINFSQYLPPGQMKLQFLLSVERGILRFQDYQYGHYTLRNIHGKFNLNKYSLLSWNVKGNADINKGMEWSTRGRCRLDELGGTGQFSAAHVSVNGLVPFIPSVKKYQIHSGFVDTKLQFAWNKDGAWLNRGVLSLSNMEFHFPKVRDSFVVKYLSTEFTPTQCEIKKAELHHHQTVIQISGLYNNKTGVIKALLSADRVQIEDWNSLLSLGPKTSLRGEGELRLEATGTVDKPNINGEIFFDNGELFWDQQKLVSQIGARVTIRDNSLRIQRLEGNWNDSLIGVSGEIDNLFNPQLNLKIYGSNLKIQSDLSAVLSERGIKIEGLMNLEGTVTGKPANPKVSGEISAQKISCQDIPFEDLSLKLEWNHSQKSLKIVDAQSKLWDGTLRARGAVLFKSKGISWRISGQVADLNINQTHLGSEWGMKGKISSDLILKGNWDKGTPFQPGGILGIFKGENLVYHDAAIEEANGVFSWLHGNLSIDSIQAKVGRGMIYGHLSWNPSDMNGNLSAENINIHQMIPDAKNYPFEGIFNGNFSFAGPPQDLTGKIDGIFSGVSWSNRKIGTVSVVLNYNKLGLDINEALVSTDAGDCRITGGVSLSSEPQFSLKLTSDNFQLRALSEWFPAIAGFKPSGTAKIDCTVNGKWNNPDITGEVNLTEPTFGPLQMDSGLLRFSGNLSAISIKQFELTRQNTSIALAGSVNSQQFDLDIHCLGLPLETLQWVYNGKSLGGTINLDGKLTGSPSNPVFNAQCFGRQLSYGTIHFQSMEAEITWQSQMIQVHSAQFHQDQALVSLEGNIPLAKAVPMNLNLEVTAFHLKELLNNIEKLPKKFEVDGLLFGTTKLRGTFDNPEIDTDGYLMGGTVNSLPVSGEFTFSYKNHQLNVDKIQLSQGTGVLSVDGVYKPGKLTRMDIFLQNFPLQAIDSFIDPSYQVNGVVNAYLLVSCSPSALSGEYRLGVSNLTLNDYPIGDFNTIGHLYNEGLSVNESTLNRKGTIFSANGFIPWPEGLLQGFHLLARNNRLSRNLKLDVNLKNFPADFANAFFPGFTISRGTVDGKFQLGGFLTKPEVVGEVDINNMTANIEELPRSIEGFQATIAFDGHTAAIKKAKGNYGQGKFDLNGYATYTGLHIDSLNLGLKGSHIFYNNPYYSGYSNVNLAITGGLVHSMITGDIALFDSRIVLASLNSEKSKTSSPWDPTLSIEINARDNVRFRQIGLADITLNGRLQVGGKLSDPTIDGEATSKQGIITFYSQTFKINQAKATFNHEQGYLPYIDVNSSLRTARAEVFLTAKGQVGSDIAVNLSSEPFMSREELFAILNWPEFNDEQNSTNVNTLLTGNLSLVTDTVFGDFLYQVRNALDLDYLYLEPNYQTSDLRLNVGRNMTKNVFLSYSRSFIYTQKDQWELDYRINSRLSLGTDYSLLEGTSWRLIYRFGF